MANYQWFTKLHRTVYQLSGGRIGARLAGRPMALLHTIGRKTGEPRVVPLVYYTLDERGPLVLASNNGGKTPAWWYNIQAMSELTVQLGKEKFTATAEEIDDSLREQYWPQMVASNPIIEDYPEKAGRKIPIILLKRRP